MIEVVVPRSKTGVLEGSDDVLPRKGAFSVLSVASCADMFSGSPNLREGVRSTEARFEVSWFSERRECLLESENRQSGGSFADGSGCREMVGGA